MMPCLRRIPRPLVQVSCGPASKTFASYAGLDTEIVCEKIAAMVGGVEIGSDRRWE